MIINKGNLKKAYEELKLNKNNAIGYLFSNTKLNQDTSKLLSNCIFTIKDNYADLNVPCRGSSLFLKEFYPNYKSTVQKLLEEEGAICVARTNLDEFGLGGSGEHSAYGKIFHPLNDKYLVGGSSSVAAATFTNNISFSIGSDTGDSVRKPASNIGKIGFKPSYGAISRYGLYAFATSMDTVAYFVHNINDLILLSSVLYKDDKKHDLSSKNLSFNHNDVCIQKPKTVAYLDCFNELEPYVAKAYKNLLEKLQKNGIKIINIKVNKTLLESIDTVYRVIAFSEASSNLSNLVGISFENSNHNKNWEDYSTELRTKNIGTMAQARLILGSYFLEKENQIKYFLKAKKIRAYLQNYFNDIHNKYDLFIFPASNDSAPLVNKQYKSSYMDYILTLANLVGNPSLTMKMGTNSNNNLPFNIALDTKMYDDVKLFSYSLYMEKLLGENNE